MLQEYTSTSNKKAKKQQIYNIFLHRFDFVCILSTISNHATKQTCAIFNILRNFISMTINSMIIGSPKLITAIVKHIKGIENEYQKSFFKTQNGLKYNYIKSVSLKPNRNTLFIYFSFICNFDNHVKPDWESSISFIVIFHIV